MFKWGRLSKNDAPLAHKELPCHIAIIMDGNGRWAKRRGLPRYAGHTYGALAFKRIVKHCYDIGIGHVTFYAFSTENWNRSKDEVEAILKLFSEYLDNAKTDLGDMKIKLNVLGDINAFSDDLILRLLEIEKYTEKNNKMTLNMAVNYGGRAEILTAVNKSLQDNHISLITSQDIENHLYTKGQPDPDLIIRPGGEKRISNFLLWQSAYSELYFCDVMWPDFKPHHLDKAISQFQKRSRRFGGAGS